MGLDGKLKIIILQLKTKLNLKLIFRLEEDIYDTIVLLDIYVPRVYNLDPNSIKISEWKIKKRLVFLRILVYKIEL